MHYPDPYGHGPGVYTPITPPFSSGMGSPIYGPVGGGHNGHVH